MLGFNQDAISAYLCPRVGMPITEVNGIAQVRNGQIVGRGVIKTLQRDKNKVNSVSEGNDCAFAVDGFSDWQQGDIVHHYTEITI